MIKVYGISDALKTEILHFTEELVSNAKKLGKTEPIAATKHQLMRYRDCWSSQKIKIPEGTPIKNHDFLQLVIDYLDR